MCVCVCVCVCACVCACVCGGGWGGVGVGVGGCGWVGLCVRIGRGRRYVMGVKATQLLLYNWVFFLAMNESFLQGGITVYCC